MSQAAQTAPPNQKLVKKVRRKLCDAMKERLRKNILILQEIRRVTGVSNFFPSHLLKHQPGISYTEVAVIFKRYFDVTVDEILESEDLIDTFNVMCRD
jgi:hypothetical protein